MYGEIHHTCDACRNIQGKLKVDNVFLIEDFFVKLAKNMYKVMEGSSMKILYGWRFRCSVMSLSIIPTMHIYSPIVCLYTLWLERQTPLLARKFYFCARVIIPLLPPLCCFIFLVHYHAMFQCTDVTGIVSVILDFLKVWLAPRAPGLWQEEPLDNRYWVSFLI